MQTFVRLKILAENVPIWKLLEFSVVISKDVILNITLRFSDINIGRLNYKISTRVV